jgi:NADH dehydrogenase
VFQPLLYQVATASLSPADICAPIRTILRKQRNCEVVLAEATAVDVGERRVILDGGSVRYDWLVLAAGAKHAYFGHDEWASVAPGLKSIEDATELRRRILLAFETAGRRSPGAAGRADIRHHRAGPTVIELAGTIEELQAKPFPRLPPHRHRTTAWSCSRRETEFWHPIPPSSAPAPSVTWSAWAWRSGFGRRSRT